MSSTAEKVTFTQKWIEQAVRHFLKKEQSDITAEDMMQIKYLKIGESFDNDFMIALSKEYPPEPFSDTSGGDEWIYALRGEDIEKFLKDESTDFHQLSFFGFDHEENLSADSRKAEKKWNDYQAAIYEESYYEEIEDEDKWEQWYEDTSKNVYKDLKLFTGLTVLRIQGTEMPDYTVFAGMENLKVMELVETYFENRDGIEKLYELEQLSCWLD